MKRKFMTVPTAITAAESQALGRIVSRQNRNIDPADLAVAAEIYKRLSDQAIKSRNP
jgi:hypothetical protein